jgi:ribosomal protein L28
VRGVRAPRHRWWGKNNEYAPWAKSKRMKLQRQTQPTAEVLLEKRVLKRIGPPLYGKRTLKRAYKFRHLMKRGARGLFGGKIIQFGNSVSFSEQKTRRTWKPTVVRKNVWSETFHKMLRFRMTATVVKKIKRLHHGIDEYLMRSPDAMLRFPAAIQLKRDLLKEHDGRQARSKLYIDTLNPNGLRCYKPYADANLDIVSPYATLPANLERLEKLRLAEEKAAASSGAKAASAGTLPATNAVGGVS